MLKKFEEIDKLKKKYDQRGGLNKITLPVEGAKWNELEVFDGTLYTMYKFITSEKKKAMRTYFNSIEDEQERDIRIFTFATLLKLLSEKLDQPKFNVQKFNYRYFRRVSMAGYY